METGQMKLLDVIENMCNEKKVYFQPMRIARDIMTTDFKTLTLDHTIQRCLKFMENHRIRHAPVVDLPYYNEKKPYFVGIVSQRDVLRINEPDVGEVSSQKTSPKALQQLLVQIVARKLYSVSQQAPVAEVITTMTGNHIDMVPVLNDKELAGIITTTDLINLFFRLDKVIHELCPELKKNKLPVNIPSENMSWIEILSSWAWKTVREIMTEEVICLEPQDNLARAIEVMQSEQFRHLPVRDKEGTFVGLVSDRDILRNLPFAGKRPLSPERRFREQLFAVKSGIKSLQLPLEDIMQRKVVHVLPDCTIHEAAVLLNKKKISCLPVVDEHGGLKGIVTVADLIRALFFVYEPAEKAGLIPSQSGVC